MPAAARFMPSPQGIPDIRLLPSPACGLVVSVDRGIRHDLNQLHHAAVLMRQDVAVQYELAGEINEAAAHPEIAGDGDRIPVLVFVDPGRRNRKGVPPDKIFLRGIARLPCLGLVGIRVTRIRRVFGCRALRLEDLNDLKWIHVDMEGVFPVGIQIRYFPLFSGVQEHYLVKVMVVELFAVDLQLAAIVLENELTFEEDISCRNIAQERRERGEVCFAGDERHGWTNGAVLYPYCQQRFYLRYYVRLPRVTGIAAKPRLDFEIICACSRGRLHQQIGTIRGREVELIVFFGPLIICVVKLNAVLCSLPPVNARCGWRAAARGRGSSCYKTLKERGIPLCPVYQTPELHLVRLHRYHRCKPAID